MKTYHGYQFKRAVVIAIHKICSDLGLRPVEVQWDAGTQTACINQSGSVRLANVKDDAVLTQGDLMRNVGMAVHELLHWMYTDFDAVRSAHIDAANTPSCSIYRQKGTHDIAMLKTVANTQPVKNHRQMRNQASALSTGPA